MNILFISHRIPYPPNKGEKIRSYNILHHLVQDHEVFVASMIDESKDIQFVPVLCSMIKQFRYDTISPLPKKLFSSIAFLQSKPISSLYFYSRRLQHWIDNLLEDSGIEAIFCSSAPTAEYIFRSRHYGRKLNDIPRIMDLIDVDSCKWEQYAERTSGMMSIIYGLEGKFLRKYEERIATEFDRVLLVSDAEKKTFLDRVPTAKAEALTNGVDLKYFSPSSSKSHQSAPKIVFTGMMDYWPNIDGTEWFLENVFPLVLDAIPEVSFCIVGGRPSASILAKANRFPNVKVTGYVDDIREYISEAALCVAPLRVARGIQNKVLEAMSMGKPVVCTPQALEGICAEHGKHLLAADTAPDFAEAVIRLLRDPEMNEQIGRNARTLVRDNFSWESNLTPLDSIFNPGISYKRNTFSNITA